MYEAREPEWKQQEVLASGACNITRNYVYLYVGAIVTFCVIWQSFHDIGLSTLLTFSVLLQVIALGALIIAVSGRKSAHGISLRSIAMQGVSFFLRLCSTCWLKGYIPVDSTGDWLYQAADGIACFLCLYLCYLITRVHRKTYLEAEDTFAAEYILAGCFVLAAVNHPDLNNRPFFDAIWTASLYVDVVSTLPQLWMVGKCGGKIDALSAHYVALVAFARLVDMIFWYHGFEELAPENGSFNLAGWTVLGAHMVHLLLVWDFLYCYARAIYRGQILDRHFDFGEGLIDV